MRSIRKPRSLTARRLAGKAEQDGSMLVFRLGKEWLAMPVRCFAEVIERRAVHSLPHRARDVVEGVVSIRGELIVTIFLEALFGLPKQASGTHRRMLVVRHATGRFVFGADEVYAGVRFKPEEVKAVPATLSLAAQSCSRGIFEWQGHMVGILDDEAVIQMVNRRLA